MRVRVSSGTQVNHQGTVYGPGQEFEVEADKPARVSARDGAVRRLSAPAGHGASNEVALWLESGWVEEIRKQTRRGKARA